MRSKFTSGWKRESVGLLMILATLAVISVMVFLLFQNQQTERAASIREQGIALVRLLSGMPEKLLDVNRARSDVLDVLRQGQSDSRLAYASLVDTRGQSLAQSPAPGVVVPFAEMPREPSAWLGERELQLSANGREVVEFHGPVLLNGDLRGYVRLGYFKPGFGIEASQVPFLASLALPVFLLTPFFYFLLRREIKPLQEANKEIESFLEKGTTPHLKTDIAGELGEFMQGLDRFVQGARQRIQHLEKEQTGLLTSTKVLSFRRARVEAVLQALPDAMMVLDEIGAVSFANAKLAALFGRSPDQILGMKPRQWCNTPEVLAFLTRFEGLSGTAFAVESLQFSPKNASDRTIGVTAHPLYMSSSSSNLIGTLVQFRDVTEEALAKRSRGEFVAQVAHEIKTPLNVLAMYSESLLGEDGKDEQFRVEGLNVIHDEVERLSTLINNLLSLTKFELGGMKIDRQRVRLQDLLNDAFANVSHSGRGQNLQFNLSVPRDMSAVYVDKDLFRIAINNLLTNAIKYNEPGGKVELVAEETGDAIYIHVRDTGIGISPADRENIFQKFYRSNDDQVRARTGHGLGLPLAQQIVMLHHGELVVESTPGEGSEFTICLGKEPVVRTGGIRRMTKILIADDEPHVIRVLKMSLERAGYAVASVPNGEVALQAIREDQPDILITDIQMPRMTGQELCQRLQAEMPDRKFLIFVLTSRTEIEHREWTADMDNLMFLEKPVSVRQLLRMIEDYVGGRASA